MSSNKPTLTIGLLWHSFSSDNLGVGALSESQIAICEAAGEKAGVNLRYLVFGTSGLRNYLPAGKQIAYGSPISIKELVTGRSGYLRDLEKCDVVLDIGEGDSFTDIYGMFRFRYHIAAKLAVLYKGIPLILSPQTIGPFEHWYTRRIATWVMRRCQKVFARDQLSADYVRSLGLPEKNVEQAVDVAFRLPYTKPGAADSDRCRIGLNVSGLLFSGGYQGDNQFGLTLDYPQLIRQLLGQWVADPSNEVWLISHVLSDLVPRDDDRVAIAQLAAEFPHARVAPQFASPSEAKSFIAGMDFMTGARMHACIAALSTGVPVVPLAYSRKFNGLFESLGYRWLADGRTMSNTDAFEIIMDGFTRRNELRATIQSALSNADVKLIRYEACLIELLSQLSDARNCKANITMG